MPAPTKTSPIDCVDDHDHPVGTIPRGEALQAGANFRTVHVFVFHDECLLLQQLSPKRDRHPERWGSSVAAYLHAGESYEQSAQRRLDEELGLQGELHLVGKTRMHDERSVKFVELYTLVNGPAAIREPDHIEELRYWARDELEAAIDESPDSFTPTFLHVFRYFQRHVTISRR